jgi:signal transduction histidine kinase
MFGRLQASSRILAAAFALSVACFLVSTGVVAYIAFAIGDSAEELATNFGPSLEHLSAIRSEVRQLESVIVRGAGHSIGASLRAEDLDRALEHAEVETQLYVKSPVYPGEELLQRAISDNWLRLRTLAREIAGVEQSGQFDKAMLLIVGRFLAMVDDLDHVLVEAIQLNTQHGDEAARRIVKQWRRVFLVGTAMTAISIILTLAAAFVAIGMIHRQTLQLQEQASESMQFAGRVAHDILSPLSSIKLFQGMVRMRVANDPLLEKSRLASESALGRIVEMVNGLLAFAKAGAQPTKGETCDVAAVVRGVVDDLRAYAEEQNVQVTLGELPTAQVRCAPGVLTSIVSNLIRNAIKYMGESPRRVVTVHVREDSGALRVDVLDTGPGIAPEWLERIFQPMVRVSTKSGDGIGLGLATVKKLAEAHGGKVFVASEVGEGSLFAVVLPRAG